MLTPPGARDVTIITARKEILNKRRTFGTCMESGTISNIPGSTLESTQTNFISQQKWKLQSNETFRLLPRLNIEPKNSKRANIH